MLVFGGRARGLLLLRGLLALVLFLVLLLGGDAVQQHCGEHERGLASGARLAQHSRDPAAVLVDDSVAHEAVLGLVEGHAARALAELADEVAAVHKDVGLVLDVERAAHSVADAVVLEGHVAGHRDHNRVVHDAPQRHLVSEADLNVGGHEPALLLVEVLAHDCFRNVAAEVERELVRLQRHRQVHRLPEGRHLAQGRSFYLCLPLYIHHTDLLAEVDRPREGVVLELEGHGHNVALVPEEQALPEGLVGHEEVSVHYRADVLGRCLARAEDGLDGSHERSVLGGHAAVSCEKLAHDLPQHHVHELRVRARGVRVRKLLQDGVHAVGFLGLELEVKKLLHVEGQRVDVLHAVVLQRDDVLVEVRVHRRHEVHVHGRGHVRVGELAHGAAQDLVELREGVGDGHEPDVPHLLERVGLGHDVRGEEEHELAAVVVLRGVVHLEQLLQRGLHLAGHDREGLGAAVGRGVRVVALRAAELRVPVAEHHVADDQAAVGRVGEVDEVLPAHGAHLRDEELELAADVQLGELVPVEHAVADAQVRVQVLVLRLEEHVQVVHQVQRAQHRHGHVVHVFFEHLVVAEPAHGEVVVLLPARHAAVDHARVQEAAPVVEHLGHVRVRHFVVGDAPLEHLADHAHAVLVQQDLEHLLALHHDVADVHVLLGHEADDAAERERRVRDRRGREQQEGHARLVLDHHHELAGVVPEDVVRLVDHEDRVLVLAEAVVVYDAVVAV
ncbi:PP66 [Orf virus]|uniref:PP66 n=1 Tax=Orf virus TaxID=10258 RepID=F1AX74_ORFV|nr:PP66 [Orf virus]